MNDKIVKTAGRKLLEKIYFYQMLIFIIILGYFFVPMHVKRAILIPFLILSAVFCLLGVFLLIVTYKQKIKGLLKLFLLFVGYASSGFLVSVVLHNVVYGVLIKLFGDDFWTRNNMPDEPVFFIIAIFVCPIVFLVGAIGSAILLSKKKDRP
ncbi:hypothetical protein KAU32_05490 [bacterium]|nr:hypothetical protein [bacterium]